MAKYILRLDDACEKRNVDNWNRMEELLDKYGIKPLVGIIPHCEDPMMDAYEVDSDFWHRVNNWMAKGWTIALHGYNHVYSTECGGINPVNRRSEFAGEPLCIQKEKIKKGIAIMREHDIEPKVFFAPSHTFDENTLRALKDESNIRVISDTIAWDSYVKNDFIFVPQQSGTVRKLPFKTTTFCYHPNTMTEKEFEILNAFLLNNAQSFMPFSANSKREYTFIDNILNYLYMRKHQ